MSEPVFLTQGDAPISVSNPLYVTGGAGGGGDASAANQTTQITNMGGLTETAPTTDTASSGLNGRLQRITQRLTTIISGLLLAAGENHIGQVGTHSTSIVVVPTVSTSPAYTTGDVMGGKMTLTNAMRVSGGTGWLASVQILDASNTKPSGILLVFNADVAATYTDNAAAPLTTADAAKVVATIPVSSGNYSSVNNRALATIQFNPVEVKAASGTNLFAVFFTTLAVTMLTTTDMQFAFGFVQE